LRLELQAVVPIIVPRAKALDKLPGRDRRGRTDNGNQFSAPLHLDAQDAETGLLAVKCDSFHGAGKMFQVAGVSIFHGDHCIISTADSESPF
jgi:hypothetical protein